MEDWVNSLPGPLRRQILELREDAFNRLDEYPENENSDRLKNILTHFSRDFFINIPLTSEKTILIETVEKLIGLLNLEELKWLLQIL